MLFNVPQFIDVEDKIAGPLTAKQLLWMFAMGGVLLILWGFLDKSMFFIVALPVAALFCTLAFYRPHGQPLIKFVVWGIFYIMQPKIYIWKRDYQEKDISKNAEDKKNHSPIVKEKKKQEVLAENISAFARTLDSEGRERSERIMEIIKENRNKKKK